MALRTDGLGRMLWRSGKPNCGCYFFTSPTAGAEMHVCPECFQYGVTALLEPEPLDQQLMLATEFVAAKLLEE